jgi:hypothetical protein
MSLSGVLWIHLNERREWNLVDGHFLIPVLVHLVACVHKLEEKVVWTNSYQIFGTHGYMTMERH